jgi:hypothetical protein
VTPAELGAAANARRARAAAGRNSRHAAIALDTLGVWRSDLDLAVVKARAASPDAPWAVVAAGLGLSKHQAAGRFRRVMELPGVRQAIARHTG